jgi:hypothetical protein
VSAPLRRVWIGLVALHLLMLAYVLPVSVLFGDSPFGGPDYQTHYQHTSTLLQVRAQFDRAWAYDPFLLAGHPTGLIFDVDNKLHFAWTSALVGLGVPLPVAFNLFTLLAAALAPALLWTAARLLGQDPRARALAFGLGVLVWNFDPTVRFCYGGGMISFAAAACLCLVVVAVMHRLLTDQRRGFAVALLVLLPLALRTHVWSFAVLVAPLIGLYLRAWRKVHVRTHMVVWTAAALGLAANLDWLVPALAHRELIVPSAGLGQATPAYLFYDFVELLVDPRRTGFVIQRTFLRGLAVIAAVAAIWAWRRDRDPRAFTGGLTLGWLIGLTYFGALVPVVQATEPYRFAVPMVLWATVLAGPWLIGAAASLRGLSRAARGAVAALLLLLLPRLYQQISPMVPELSPLAPPPSQATRSLPSARLGGVVDDWKAVVTWLEGQPDRGRVLVQYGPLGEYLRWATDRPILGGFHDRRMIFQDANLFYFSVEDERFNAGLAAYLERYNVSHVVMTYPYIAELERRSDLLAAGGIHGGLHRVYTVKRPGGYFMTGSGRVDAGLNRISVRDAAPAPGGQSLVLRFHWMDELRCSPDCTVRRFEVAGDSAGFIEVSGAPNLPREFAVELEY